MLIHEQVTLRGGVEVDGGIANLLTALWELGLRTSHSCQGTAARLPEEEHPSSAAYISFPQATDAFSFFSQTLDAISTPDRLARIVVDVRIATRPLTPGCEKRGPAVSLELDVSPGAQDRDLRGCVRFDPELMPQIETAFAADRA